MSRPAPRAESPAANTAASPPDELPGPRALPREPAARNLHRLFLLILPMSVYYTVSHCAYEGGAVSERDPKIMTALRSSPEAFSPTRSQAEPGLDRISTGRGRDALIALARMLARRAARELVSQK